MTRQDTYLPDDRYTRLVAAIADLFSKPNPFEGAPGARAWLENEIKHILSADGDISPESIRADMIRAGLEEAEKQRDQSVADGSTPTPDPDDEDTNPKAA